jgi:hypothetical protein
MLMETRLMRALRLCAAISFIALSTSGCVTAYVDGGLQKASLADVRKPARPTDVQLLFQFQTKGTANAKATDILKKEVGELVSSSGLFATLSSDPALSGAILSVTINNVPITDQSDAAAKGFATGLTFGLVGSAVTDGYICTMEYLPPGAANKVTTTSRHAIHATMGAKGAPPNGIKAKNLDEAVHTMTRQIVLDGLKQLSAAPVFAAQEAS